MTNLAVHFKGKLDALVSMKIQIKGHSNFNDYFTFFRTQQNTISGPTGPAPGRLTSRSHQAAMDKSKKNFTHTGMHKSLCARAQ